MPTVTDLPYSLLKIIKNQDGIHENNNKLYFSESSRESSKLLYRNLPKPLSDVFAHAQKQKYADLFSKPGAICKNVSCTRESMAESNDRAPAKPSPAKSRRFQTFEKACHEKWSLVTIHEKGDTCVTLKCAVDLLL